MSEAPLDAPPQRRSARRTLRPLDEQFRLFASISQRELPARGTKPPRMALTGAGWLLGCIALLSACAPAATTDGEEDVAGTGASHSASGGLGNSASGGGTIVGDGDGDGDGDITASGGAPPVGEIPGGVALDGHPENYRFIRLTNEQWENSVRDIFQLQERSGASNTFFPDPPHGKFTNNEQALFVGEELLGDFQRTAEELAATISSNAGLLDSLGGVNDPSAFIAHVGRRAYRRELSPDEQSKFEALWQQGAGFFSSGDDNVDGARVFIETLLQAPRFVYRIELSETGKRLSGLELATKLSFLLRNTTPSDDLLAAAEAGDLDTDAGLLTVAEEMLSEREANDALTSFHREMFGVDRYQNIEKDPSRFPDYSGDLKEVLIESDLLFFRRIFDEGEGVREMYQSDVAYINDETAGYYGVPSPGSELSEVTLEGDRPGILTRIGFLAYNATLAHPDPIHRGVDINTRLLCVKLSPPPGEIPPLPPFEEGQTNRERVEAHTGQGICANCHLEIINPLGYAFENFDAMGQFRSEDNGNSIDTASAYDFSEGLQGFSGAVELAGLLAESQQAHGCYSASLAEFFLTRDLSGLDEELVTAMQQASLGSDMSVRELILLMIQSPLFTNAQGAAQ